MDLSTLSDLDSSGKLIVGQRGCEAHLVRDPRRTSYSNLTRTGRTKAVNEKEGRDAVVAATLALPYVYADMSKSAIDTLCMNCVARARFPVDESRSVASWTSPQMRLLIMVRH